MVSPHLQAEHDSPLERLCQRLLELIQAIRDSGSVAPLNVWISPAPKGEHLYYKLSSKNPEYKNQRLGKAGSEKYRDWRARIQRREAILVPRGFANAELEQQLSMLQALIDRQATVMAGILPAAIFD